MFTVKFHKLNEQGQETSVGISCPHYSIFNSNNGVITITTYPTMFEENGVERHVVSAKHKGSGAPARDYDICYVENEKGKTINHIKQPE